MAGVPALFTELCKGTVRQHMSPHLSTDHSFTSFVLPSRSSAYQPREDLVSHLRNTAFDLLLLRAWEWFGSWKTPMNPVDVCLSFTVHYHICGLHEQAEKLKGAIETLLGGK